MRKVCGSGSEKDEAGKEKVPRGWGGGCGPAPCRNAPPVNTGAAGLERALMEHHQDKATPLINVSLPCSPALTCPR